MLIAIGLAVVFGCSERRDVVTIFAAASTADAVERFAQTSAHPIRINSAASSTLARQIAAGAPADLFLSADVSWMDWLADRNAIEPGLRADLLGNRLVIVSADPAFDLASFEGRIALGDPDHVPAGRYAKAALQADGRWHAIADRTVPTAHVRAALALAERGEATAAIVYATDARVARRAKVVAELPTPSPIRYPIAVIRGHRRPSVDATYEALRAADVFAEFGFEAVR